MDEDKMIETRVSQLASVQCEALHLFNRKNNDYGDSFAKYGPVGVIVRLGDKIERLVNISKNGMTLVDDESIRDTLIDLHNYAAMAVMLLDEKKRS
jgi:hypothetical protein